MHTYTLNNPILIVTNAGVHMYVTPPCSDNVLHLMLINLTPPSLNLPPCQQELSPCNGKYLTVW